MSMNQDMDFQKVMSNDYETLITCVAIFDKRLIELFGKYQDKMWDKQRLDVRPSQIAECAFWKLFEGELPEEFEDATADEEPPATKEQATADDSKTTSAPTSGLSGQVPGNVPILERING